LFSVVTAFWTGANRLVNAGQIDFG
jgi:hypothetical protein